MADLFALTQQALAGTDLELVDIERLPLGLLRITIDRSEGVRIEDCEMVSRQLSRVFEVENIEYNRLEVGSPGIDRPLKRPEDFLRFQNERIEIRLRQPIDNRKVFSGTLCAAEPSGSLPQAVDAQTVFGLQFEQNKGQLQLLRFTFNDIDRAKLDPILDFKGKKR